MRATSPISRSQFLRFAVGGALGSFVVLHAVACGGDDDGGDGNPATDAPATTDGAPGIDAPQTVDGPPTPIDAPATPIDAPAASCLNNGTNVAIAGNHGHVLVVSSADVSAGQQKVYDISAATGHQHNVTLTAAHFQMLAQNTPITVTSSSSGTHTHSVTVSCA